MEGSFDPPTPEEPRRVLYRCPNRTNILCPCGAAARKLNKLGLEYETRRLPYRRANRPEIIELTGQKYLPVLVDGDEVIHDSKRIREYLDHAYGAPNDAPAGDDSQED